MHRIIWVSLAAGVLSIMFFVWADFVMAGYEDCIIMDGISLNAPYTIPSNCTDGIKLGHRDMLRFAGVGLFLFSVFFPVFVAYRQKQSLIDDVDLITPHIFSGK